ncbi:response regulator transcription factor [Lacrimispora sp. 210928-DFI.3.58]|uniref:response regulator transcription factor n=1 Tax=Lacrimispora sp. 210928-DFI.3.58 TaxID=2883214 RepID=UPI0015B3FBE8|nr:response regulator [Lacrimispora sp. 210928-DFI.3.58]MCB7317198.1 response regulator [Lacrimispora sp. 210928-DFI.3.58]
MYRVLLADDEQIERMALARRLKKQFGDMLVISEAINGAEALEVFKREKSQIIIMDIAMPEMNGVEAAEHIRKMDEDCIIVFLTAYDEFSYAKRAIVIRALDYLLKPCEQEELVAVMEEAMRLTDRRMREREWEEESRTALREQRSEASWQPVEDGDLEEAGGGRMNQVAEAIREYIRSNYMKEISMQDAAKMMNYSDAYFCKLFKQCFDQNFTTYLTRFRINEAKRLLQDKNISVKDVSLQVGYNDSNYFAKVFKRLTGMIPSEYRDRNNA